jgi:hypothetical protein
VTLSVGLEHVMLDFPNVFTEVRTPGGNLKETSRHLKRVVKSSWPQYTKVQVSFLFVCSICGALSGSESSRIFAAEIY